MQVGPQTPLSARLAIYENGRPEPQVEEMRGEGPVEFIHRLSTRIEQVIRRQGGTLPHPAVVAIVENLVHARFESPTASVMDCGCRLRIADRGPGIADKRLAMEPGFSSAGVAEREVIQGVGAGLALAARLVEEQGGNIDLADNLGGGTVVTLSVPAAPLGQTSGERPEPVLVASGGGREPEPGTARWTETVMGAAAVTDVGKRVLLLLAELGGAGPETISNELRLSLPAAELELERLRRLGYLDPNGGKHMALTAAGLKFLEGIFSE